MPLTEQEADRCVHVHERIEGRGLEGIVLRLVREGRWHCRMWAQEPVTPFEVTREGIGEGPTIAAALDNALRNLPDPD